MMSGLAGGVTFYGLPAFLALYGLMNDLSLKQASLLLTAFMVGSVVLGFGISTLSDYVNRTVLTVCCLLVGVVCAIYLPLASYNFPVTFSILDNLGGLLAVLSIGFLMGAGVEDGIVYVTVFSALIYFIYSLSQYEVE